MLIKNGQFTGIPIGVYLADAVTVSNVTITGINKKVFDCIYSNLMNKKGCNVDGHALTKEENDYVNIQLFRDIDYTKTPYIENVIMSFVRNLKDEQQKKEVADLCGRIKNETDPTKKAALVAELNNAYK